MLKKGDVYLDFKLDKITDILMDQIESLELGARGMSKGSLPMLGRNCPVRLNRVMASELLEFPGGLRHGLKPEEDVGAVFRAIPHIKEWDEVRLSALWRFQEKPLRKSR